MGAGIALVIAVLAWPTRGLSLLALLAYPVLALRIRSRTLRDGRSKSDALLFAVACVVGKFPGVVGQLTYCCRRLRGSRMTIIEYKSGRG